MVGFSPLASSTLGEAGGVINYELVASNIATQPATVQSTTLTQDHNLGVVSFVTGAPLLQTTSLTQDHSLTSIALLFGTPILGSPSVTQEHNLLVTNLTAGTPELANVNVTQDHDLTASGFTLGSPVVSDAPMAEDETFSAPSLETGNVVVEDTSISQDHSVTATNIVSLTPELIKSALTQDHNLQPTEFISGSPQVGQTDLTENYNLLATGFVTDTPQIDVVTAIEQENFTADNIVTGNPFTQSAELSQDHSLSPVGILTPLPDLGEPVDPNAIVVQEIKEIEQMFGGWPRRAYEVPDGRLVQGEREIEATFGDRVSVDRKAKSLIKFGKSADLVADRLETVWTVGGHETYVTDNTIEYISSSSAADTQTIRIECHTVSGTGADAKFTFLVQEVTLDGQNPVALDTPVARVSHAYNTNGTELVGRVTVYENTTVVGGVPSDETKIHIDIPQGLQGSLKGATTFSDSDYYILTGGFGSVSKKQEAAVDFYLEVRTAGGVFIQRAAISATTGGPWDIDLDPAVIVPKNADVRITAESGTNNAHVFGVFKGYLAKVLN